MALNLACGLKYALNEHTLPRVHPLLDYTVCVHNESRSYRAHFIHGLDLNQ